MGGIVLVYSTTAGSLGGGKWKVETPMRGFGIGSTVSRKSSRRVCELVEQCCRCTGYLTCCTTGPSARAFECRDNVQ